MRCIPQSFSNRFQQNHGNCFPEQETIICFVCLLGFQHILNRPDTQSFNLQSIVHSHPSINLSSFLHLQSFFSTCHFKATHKLSLSLSLFLCLITIKPLKKGHNFNRGNQSPGNSHLFSLDQDYRLINVLRFSLKSLTRCHSVCVLRIEIRATTVSIPSSQQAGDFSTSFIFIMTGAVLLIYYWRSIKPPLLILA